MDETEIRHVLEAALLASHHPLTLDKLVELFAKKAPEVDKDVVTSGLEALDKEYAARGLELKQVASGYRIQVRSRMASWLQPLWEERPPRYSRALLETLALIAYRQPVTRGEIEDVRGVSVNTNIIRTMLERDWIRVVGHRDVPGKPEMFGTTKQFLDYFGLQSIDQLPALAEVREQGPEAFPQADFVEALEGGSDGAPIAQADTAELTAAGNVDESGEQADTNESAVAADEPVEVTELQAAADTASDEAEAEHAEPALAEPASSDQRVVAESNEPV